VLFLGYIAMLLRKSIWGLLPVLPMMAVFHFVMIKKDLKNNVKPAIPHILAVYLFCIAILAVLSITSVPDVFRISFDPIINLVPLAGISASYLQYASNILLFLPVGFLLPMLWKKFEKWRLTFFCGFFFSLSIEIIQLFNNRITDVDDLIMNTAGTMIGYLIFLSIKKRFPKISVFAIGHENHWRWEPYFCFCFAWASMLFFVHFITRAVISGAP